MKAPFCNGIQSGSSLTLHQKSPDTTGARGLSLFLPELVARTTTSLSPALSVTLASMQRGRDCKRAGDGERVALAEATAFSQREG